jgi:hypothetical protein
VSPVVNKRNRSNLFDSHVFPTHNRTILKEDEQ